MALLQRKQNRSTSSVQV